MSILFIILGIIFLITVILIFIMCGENGYNKNCANGPYCANAIRCKAKSKYDINCFIKKKNRGNRYVRL